MGSFVYRVTEVPEEGKKEGVKKWENESGKNHMTVLE